MPHEAENKSDPSEIQRFTELWMKYQNAVASFVCLSIRDFHHAEDVVQDIAKSAASSFDRYDPERPFINWVIAIAKQRISDHYRREGGRRKMISAQAVEMLAQAQVEMADSVDDRISALRFCLTQLSARQTKMIEMRYGQALSPRQVAEKVGAKHTAVNVSIYRIRKSLG